MLTEEEALKVFKELYKVKSFTLKDVEKHFPEIARLIILLHYKTDRNSLLSYDDKITNISTSVDTADSILLLNICRICDIIYNGNGSDTLPEGRISALKDYYAKVCERVQYYKELDFNVLI